MYQAARDWAVRSRVTEVPVAVLEELAGRAGLRVRRRRAEGGREGGGVGTSGEVESVGGEGGEPCLLLSGIIGMQMARADGELVATAERRRSTSPLTTPNSC